MPNLRLVQIQRVCKQQNNNSCSDGVTGQKTLREK